MSKSKCRSCAAEIVWLATVNNKPMPTNADTVQPGDKTFDRTKGHISHYATCPNADMHRQARKLPSVTETTQLNAL